MVKKLREWSWFDELPWRGWYDFALAILAGMLVLRAWALSQAEIPAGMATGIIGRALVFDLQVWIGSLPLLCLLSWPLLHLLNPRVRIAAVAALGCLWLLLLTALEQYFGSAHVPLGADLFGYSLSEILITAKSGAGGSIAVMLGWLWPLLAFAFTWYLVRRSHAPAWLFRKWVVPGLLVLAIVVFALPVPPIQGSESARGIASNKLGFFTKDTLRFLTADEAAYAGGNTEYPFAHSEDTPDTLGPFFKDSTVKPNIVLIVVEGLGRTFSGPGAPMGSFTPYLDELAGRSLYWENFLAPQGRTFGVLPSLLGSLPHGKQGFTGAGAQMPASNGLLKVLHGQGYEASYLTNTDADFDNFRQYLRTQDVQYFTDKQDFGSAYADHRFAEWGYDDTALAKYIEDNGLIPRTQPSATVVQTIGMHNPFTFPGQEAWRGKVQQRIAQLGLTGDALSKAQQNVNILSTVMAADDALRRILAKAATQPGFENTIFVITGDHRLPEIPMDTRIERYHVPLIIYSPLLTKPARFKDINSQLDVTPSLLALLSHKYGLLRESIVSWTGRGLGTSTTFVGNQDIPLKQTKTVLNDFVSGVWFYSSGDLYHIGDNLTLTQSDETDTTRAVEGRLNGYLAANNRMISTGKLLPPDATQLVEYKAPNPESRKFETPAAYTTLYAHDLKLPEFAMGQMKATVSFTNAGKRKSLFVPLLVVLEPSTKELKEAYGTLTELDKGQSAQTTFAVDLSAIPPGDYFVAVLPSDPDNGKRVGEGIFHTPLHIGPRPSAPATPTVDGAHKTAPAPKP